MHQAFEVDDSSDGRGERAAYFVTDESFFVKQVSFLASWFLRRVGERSSLKDEVFFREKVIFKRERGVKETIVGGSGSG